MKSPKNLEKPDDLSENAFAILQKAYENYPNKDGKCFDDFSSITLPREELEACLEQLHNQHYVFWNYRNTDEEYLYLLAHPLLLSLL